MRVKLQMQLFKCIVTLVTKRKINCAACTYYNLSLSFLLLFNDVIKLQPTPFLARERHLFIHENRVSDSWFFCGHAGEWTSLQFVQLINMIDWGDGSFREMVFYLLSVITTKNITRIDEAKYIQERSFIYRDTHVGPSFMHEQFFWKIRGTYWWTIFAYETIIQLQVRTQCQVIHCAKFELHGSVLKLEYVCTTDYCYLQLIYQQ